MAAELIRLDRRPTAWQFTVGVNGMAPTVTGDRLMQVASEGGGPVANCVLFQLPERAWATVQFYCASDADRFQQQCDGRMLDGRRVEIGPLPESLKSKPTNDAHLQDAGLPASKAIELVNHLLGFNGWTSEVLDIVPAPPPPPPSTDPGLPRFRARVRVHLGGVQAVGEGDTGELGAAHQREQTHAGHAKKAAVTNALKAALARLAIIRFRSGKVVVRQLVPEAGGAENCAPQQSRQAPELSEWQSRQVPEDVD